MSARADREDTRAQEHVVDVAREQLITMLGDCASECTLVAKALRRTNDPEKIAALVAGAKGEWLAVERAEENLLIALYDLAGARGADL